MKYYYRLFLLPVILLACRRNDPRDQYEGNYNCTVITQEQVGTAWVFDTSFAVVPVAKSGKTGDKLTVNGTTVTLSGTSFTEGVQYGITGSFTGSNISFAVGPPEAFSTYEGVKQ